MATSETKFPRNNHDAVFVLSRTKNKLLPKETTSFVLAHTPWPWKRTA